MSDAATVSTLPSQAEARAEARALVARQLAVLGRLAEAGLNIALAVERQVLAAEQGASEASSPEAGSPEVGSAEAVQAVQAHALAYGRVSRAVRLTIALQSRLLKELQELDTVVARQQYNADFEATRVAQLRAQARKGRVKRIVGRLIWDEAQDVAEGERQTEEALERLEHDDIYGDLQARPISEIIAMVCKDLGLAPDWIALAEEAWAQEEIASGAPGAPLVALRGRDPPEAGSDANPADPARTGSEAASP